MNDKYFKRKLDLLKVCHRDDEKIAILKKIYNDGYKEQMTEIKL